MEDDCMEEQFLRQVITWKVQLLWTNYYLEDDYMDGDIPLEDDNFEGPIVLEHVSGKRQVLLAGSVQAITVT